MNGIKLRDLKKHTENFLALTPLKDEDPVHENNLALYGCYLGTPLSYETTMLKLVNKAMLDYDKHTFSIDLLEVLNNLRIDSEE